MYCRGFKIESSGHKFHATSHPNKNENEHVLVKSGSGYVIVKPVSENFGSFSISASVRGPYKQPQSADGKWNPALCNP